MSRRPRGQGLRLGGGCSGHFPFLLSHSSCSVQVTCPSLCGGDRRAPTEFCAGREQGRSPHGLSSGATGKDGRRAGRCPAVQHLEVSCVPKPCWHTLHRRMAMGEANGGTTCGVWNRRRIPAVMPGSAALGLLLPWPTRGGPPVCPLLPHPPPPSTWGTSPHLRPEGTGGPVPAVGPAGSGPQRPPPAACSKAGGTGRR